MISPASTPSRYNSFISFTDTTILNKVDLWSIHRSCLLDRLDEFLLTDSYREWRIEGIDIYKNCQEAIRISANTLTLFNYLFKLPFSGENDRVLIALDKFCASFKSASPLLLYEEFLTVLKLFEEGTARHEIYFCKAVSFFFLTLSPIRRESLHQIFRIIKKLYFDDSNATKQEMVIERLAMHTIKSGETNPDLVFYLLELLANNVNMIFTVDERYLGMIEKMKREVTRQRTQDYATFIRPKKKPKREELISFYDFLKEEEGRKQIEKEDSPITKKGNILKRVFGRSKL